MVCSLRGGLRLSRVPPVPRFNQIDDRLSGAIRGVDGVASGLTVQRFAAFVDFGISPRNSPHPHSNAGNRFRM